MSESIGEIIILPPLVLFGAAIVVGVWIGGDGGNVSWISEAVSALVVPALIIGCILAAVAALSG